MKKRERSVSAIEIVSVRFFVLGKQLNVSTCRVSAIESAIESVYVLLYQVDFSFYWYISHRIMFSFDFHP